jgi:Bacterial Ig-like domain
LVAGGRSATGLLLDAAELWEPVGGSVVAVPLTTGRMRHSATLLASGQVLIWGGVDVNGRPVSGGDLYDPGTRQVTAIVTPPATDSAPAIVASTPADGAVDVPLNVQIAIRFATPMDVTTLTGQTVFLLGPEGLEAPAVVAAEAGRLVFVTPSRLLQPGTRYTVSLSGAAARGGDGVGGSDVITLDDGPTGVGP